MSTITLSHPVPASVPAEAELIGTQHWCGGRCWACGDTIERCGHGIDSIDAPVERCCDGMWTITGSWDARPFELFPELDIDLCANCVTLELHP